MPAAIEITGLTKRFGAVTAVSNLNLSIAKGEVFGLVGPDGAGKTTTLRILCGLVDPTEGSTMVAGFDPVKQTTQLRDQIGYMAQRFGLYTDLTVEENIDFYADLFGIARSLLEPLKQKLLAMTRMAPFRERPAGKLSGGMKQKLALMCALLNKPAVLLLDEPTNGVDPVSRRDFWLILEDLVRDGMTLVVSTAYLDEAERCGRVGLMHEGKLIRCGTPAELKAAMTGRFWEVEASDMRATRRDLETRPGVLGVKPSGATLHVHSTAEVTLSDWLPARLIEPSLEDVFVAVVSEKEQHA